MADVLVSKLVDVADVPLDKLFALDDNSALAHAVRRVTADAAAEVAGDDKAPRGVSAFNSAL